MLICFKIDYTNAASVKVLQVGEDRNILNELRMTSDEYNWVQSIYFVGSPLTPLTTAYISYFELNPQLSGAKHERGVTCYRSATLSSKCQAIFY